MGGPQVSNKRNWPRYAYALDRRLEGATLQQIGNELDISRETVRGMLLIAEHRLAYRVFKGIPSTRYIWELQRQEHEQAEKRDNDAV